MLLARHGRCPVQLWAHRAPTRAALAAARSNERHLPGLAFPEQLSVSMDLNADLAQTGDVLVAVPSSAFHSVLSQISSQLLPHQSVAWATKGLEPQSGRWLHEVARDCLPRHTPVAAVCGPTFAREVAAGLPAAMTVAAEDIAIAEHWAGHLRGPTLRAYTSTDLMGVAIGGAVKNVLAIAAGIADGLGFGANTRAALITRGLAEMMRLGAALGGKTQTFMGLAGLGDLVLTCTDDQSRNRRLGLALGRGESLTQALTAIAQTVEGMDSAHAVWRLAQRHGIDMPITEQVHHVLAGHHSARAAVTALLARDPRPEWM